MFERQFGLRENPFAAGHQSRFVYPSREHQEALAHLRYGIENREPFVLITGEVGTGKTTALYDVLSEWQSRVAVALITNSALSRDELLEEICVRFGVGVTPGATKPHLLIQLERHLLAVRARGERAILLLDEAQNLHRDLLEEIRLLSNLEAQGDKLVQVFLVGQPELETILGREELRQLRQRIAVHYRLHPLSEDDTERYIHHRITVAGGHALTVFPSESAREVYRLTHGIPREINTVAAQAMLNAFVEDSGIVMPEHVRAVEQETEFQSVMRGRAAQAAAAAEAAPAPPARSTAPPAAEPKRERPSETTAPRPVEAKPVRPAEPSLPPDTGALAPSAAELEASLPREAPQPPAAPPRPVDPLSVKPAIRREDWEAWRASLAGESVEETEPSFAPARSSAAATPPPAVTPKIEPKQPIEAKQPIEVKQPIEAKKPVEAKKAEEPKRAAPKPAAETLHLVRPPTADSVPPSEHLNEFDFEQHLPKWEQSKDVEPIGAPVSDFIQAHPARPEPTLTSREAQPEPPFSVTGSAPRSTLPPSLRRKLEFEEDTITKGSGAALRWFAVAAVAAIVIVGAILGARIFAKKSVVPTSEETQAAGSVPSETAPTVTTETPSGATEPPPGATPPPASAVTPGPAPPAPTTPLAASGTGSSTPSGAEGVPMATATVAATTAHPATTTASKPATPKPAAEAKVYGIAVATFLNEDRAERERVKLAGQTNLVSRVTPVMENGDQVYRVILGAFTDRDNAENVASRLIESGAVDEARIMTYKKEPAKR